VTYAVHAVMTNNAKREQVDAANPRAANKCGHVIEILEEGNDPAARRFRWRLFLVCGDPKDPSTYFAGFPKEKVSPFPPRQRRVRSCGQPLDRDRRPAGDARKNDGIFAVPTAGPGAGSCASSLRPVGAEVCGPAFTSDFKTLFAAIQHPGEGGTIAKPRSRWPDGSDVPRPSVIAVRHGGQAVVGA